MKNVIKNFHFLHLLSKAKPLQRRALLKTADKSQIICICEICKNLLSGNLDVNFKKIKKFKTLLRNLANKKHSLARKKTVLHQSGAGFLPLILPAVLSAIGGLAGRAIGNRI